MLLTLSLISIGAAAKAVQDSILFHGLGAGNKFFDVTTSWKNKYKNGDPKQGPAFFWSTTALVFFTDGFHLTQFFFLNSIFIALVTYHQKLGVIFDFILLRVVFGIVFESIYIALNYHKGEK